jgi:hypothetical protein
MNQEQFNFESIPAAGALDPFVSAKERSVAATSFECGSPHAAPVAHHHDRRGDGGGE